RSARHAERVADLVDDVLIGRGDRAACRLLAVNRRPLPVGVDVTRGEARAGVPAREVGFGSALGVGANDGGLARWRALEIGLGLFPGAAGARAFFRHGGFIRSEPRAIDR